MQTNSHDEPSSPLLSVIPPLSPVYAASCSSLLLLLLLVEVVDAACCLQRPWAMRVFSQSRLICVQDAVRLRLHGHALHARGGPHYVAHSPLEQT